MEQTVASKKSSEVYNNFKMCGTWCGFCKTTGFNNCIYLFKKRFLLGSITSHSSETKPSFGCACFWEGLLSVGVGLFIRRNFVSKIWDRRFNIFR